MASLRHAHFKYYATAAWLDEVRSGPHGYNYDQLVAPFTGLVDDPSVGFALSLFVDVPKEEQLDYEHLLRKVPFTKEDVSDRRLRSGRYGLGEIIRLR